MLQKKQPLLFAMASLLGLSLAINIFQARYIYKSQVSDEMSNSRGPAKPGTKLSPLEVADISGGLTRIEYKKRKPTILYIFQPSCVWCKRNAQAVNLLSSRTTAKYDMVGLSLHDEGLSEFISQHRVGFPIYKATVNSNLDAYGFEATPETVVIAPDSSVIRSWNGAYLDANQAETEKFFGTSLSD